MPLSVVQYSFLFGEALPVKMEPHGNARHDDRPYIRTQHSTLDDIKENVSSMAPKAAVKRVYDNAGGVMNISTLSEVPRNRRQACNAKSHNHSTSGIASNQHKDLIYDLLEQHYGSLKTYVRTVSFDDSVMCTLATDQQLSDIERFCCNRGSTNSSVFGIDPTFNLGDFYVTVTTYENLMLKSRLTGSHPVFIGPMFVHQRRTYETYFHFASEILKHRKALASLNAIGTDGEEQLSSAFGTVFPGAVKLLCVVHKRDNVRAKLRQLAVPEYLSKDILDSIFGYQLGDTFFKGLVDADDVQDFNAKLEELKPKWHAICPDFHPWFVSHEAELFCSSMIRSVRSAAGLGHPPRSYTTNNNESINRVLKEKVGYKKQEWPEFNSKMLELVKEQQEEYSKAVCGCGEYELCDDYKHLEVPYTEWVQMTPEQRKVKIEKVMKHGLKDSSLFIPCQKSSSRTPGLSVEWSSAHITHLQPNRVADMWRKAEEILSSPNLVVPAAGNASARQVASTSGGTSGKSVTPPHFVYTKKSPSGVEVRCDCPVFHSTPNICQHSLAAAEDMSVLKEYLAWVRKTKATGLNLSNLICKEIPKSSGQKSTSRRKGAPKGRKKPILMEKEGIVTSHCTSSSFPTFPPASSSPPASSPPSSSFPPALPLASSSFPPASYSFPPESSSFPPASSSFPPASSFPYPMEPFPAPSSLPVFPPVPFPTPSAMFHPGQSLYYNQPTFNSNYYSPVVPEYTPYAATDQPVFSVKHLQGTRIRTCYGCGNPIRQDISYVPPPPHDVVISYRERRYYRDPTTHEMRLTQTEENTYYHLMLRCVTLKHRAFHGSMLKIPESSVSNLQDVHRRHIMEQFGIRL